MEKYLFTDGTNVVREVQSDEELQKLIQSSADTGKIRIWIYNTNEWISYAEFSKSFIVKKPAVVNGTDRPLKKAEPAKEKKVSKRYGFFTKLFIALATIAAVFLVYNFTRIKWHKASPLELTAARPGNVPIMNIDSLIAVIEYTRRQKLDKITATNLRIRNTWPDRIQLLLRTDRDTSVDETKFYNIHLSIDNSTGYHIDNAVIELVNWKDGQAINTDTIHVDNISYTAQAKRNLEKEYRGDSLTISFLSLRAKAFNFCYEAERESNYGNLNDRWFCRE